MLDMTKVGMVEHLIVHPLLSLKLWEIIFIDMN